MFQCVCPTDTIPEVEWTHTTTLPRSGWKLAAYRWGHKSSCPQPHQYHRLKMREFRVGAPLVEWGAQWEWSEYQLLGCRFLSQSFG